MNKLYEKKFKSGFLDNKEFEIYSNLEKKLTIDFGKYYNQSLLKLTRINEFVKSINFSVTHAPSYLRYIDLTIHRNLSEESIQHFSYKLDLIEHVTDGPPMRGGNYYINVFPRIHNYDLFSKDVLKSRFGGKTSMTEAHHIGFLRSPKKWQKKDIRRLLNYEPRIGIEKSVIFEAKGFRQIFKYLKEVKQNNLILDLTNFLLVSKNIYLSIFTSVFEILEKEIIVFKLDNSGLVTWETKENLNYKYPWDEEL